MREAALAMPLLTRPSMSADAIMPAPTKPTFMLMLGDCALCGKNLARGGHSRLATIDRGGVLARGSPRRN